MWEVHAALPPVLRAHVLVLADRGYGSPILLDLLAALGWHGVVRLQGQVRVQWPDGTTRPLRSLVPRPSAPWPGPRGATVAPLGPSDPLAPPDPLDPSEAAAPAAPVAVFKKAGWRQGRVVAAWAEGQAEPWLLVTTLPATRARLREYARRWAIERLFLTWKSHGWHLEASGLSAPAPVARLLTGYVLATWWHLAAALPVAQAHLDDLAAQAVRRTGRPPRLSRPCQLRLPLDPGTGPWIAKYSLLTQGRQVCHRTPARTTTPALCWAFPDWEAPTWSVQCHELYAGTRPRQFSVSP